MNRLGALLRRGLPLLRACLLGGVLLILPAGCVASNSIMGVGGFRDYTQVKVGMAPNDVNRVMGSNYKEVWEESMQGMFMGNYAWDYPEARIYFNTQGVTKVVPYK